MTCRRQEDDKTCRLMSTEWTKHVNLRRLHVYPSVYCRMQHTTDWNAVRLDYMAGMPTVDVAKKYNLKLTTVKAQIFRNKWLAAKLEAKEHMSKVVSIKVYEDTKTLVEQGNQLLAKMVKDAEKSTEMLMHDYAQPVGFDELEKRERTAGMLVKRIKETCGLDDAKQAGLVVIGQFTRFDDSQEAKTIDVNASVTPDEPVKE